MDYNLTNYFDLDQDNSDDTWNSLVLNRSGLRELAKAKKGIKDYAKNRIS